MCDSCKLSLELDKLVVIVHVHDSTNKGHSRQGCLLPTCGANEQGCAKRTAVDTGSVSARNNLVLYRRYVCVAVANQGLQKRQTSARSAPSVAGGLSALCTSTPKG